MTDQLVRPKPPEFPFSTIRFENSLNFENINARITRFLRWPVPYAETSYWDGGVDRWYDVPAFDSDPRLIRYVIREQLETLGSKSLFRFNLSAGVRGLKRMPSGYIPGYTRDDSTSHWFDCAVAAPAQLAEAFARTFEI